jgi:uncharacterized protein YutE (UPF0331/DUF86 family)
MLQILTEIVIDVCQRIISLNDQSPATTGAHAVQRCVQLGVFSSAKAYQVRQVRALLLKYKLGGEL